MDAYTPYPVEGLAVELGMRKTRLPFVVLMGGLVGAGVGFFMQYYSMAIRYTFNVGGRPYNSWPVFIPITFEMLILVGALAAFLGMMLLNGLPRPHHPVFNVPQFARSSQDRFFLCIEATDTQFDRQARPSSWPPSIRTAKSSRCRMKRDTPRSSQIQLDPTLRVGTHRLRRAASPVWTRNVERGVPTMSVGTRNNGRIRRSVLLRAL